ncbi:hypothetical protein FA048_15825 [Pedobacter polaris]|uniref:Uncharacterized protein n=1 Tax=Pedobacter polaris TaxID=2571273 RepID=A0A4U1CML9_9SPHI|nr:hypothetical protein [Pedobacter polaris]TKC06672.1 hypothetical protein FA048_15825 [Pedobacter polaris]
MTEKEKATADIYKMLKDKYPNSILYVMPEQLTKKLKSFMLIREDLSFVTQVTEQLISLKESHNPNDIIEFALWQSIIITYGKCFTDNKAGMSKLEKSLFEKYDKKYQEVHDHLMHLRHSYIAHRDDTVNEQAMVFIKVSKTGHMLDGDTENIIIARKLASPRVRDLKSLIELLQLLIEEADVKIQKNGDKAHNAFLKNYTREQAKSFLVNNMKFD